MKICMTPFTRRMNIIFICAILFVIAYVAFADSRRLIPVLIFFFMMFIPMGLLMKVFIITPKGAYMNAYVKWLRWNKVIEAELISLDGTRYLKLKRRGFVVGLAFLPLDAICFRGNYKEILASYVKDNDVLLGELQKHF